MASKGIVLVIKQYASTLNDTLICIKALNVNNSMDEWIINSGATTASKRFLFFLCLEEQCQEECFRSKRLPLEDIHREDISAPWVALGMQRNPF